MSKGTPRITIRVPQPLIDAMKLAVLGRNEIDAGGKRWTDTEYIVQAIVDKLNHDARSRGVKGGWRQASPEDWFPREAWEE